MRLRATLFMFAKEIGLRKNRWELCPVGMKKGLRRAQSLLTLNLIP